MNIRAYHLQCLLFVIDRHWSLFHADLRENTINTILQLISYDDANIQSWALICLSAVAHAYGSQRQTPSHLPSSSESGPWDTTWAHAMRRSNVPRVSRAACHAAHILLLHAKLFLSYNKVLAEIETLAKDLTVQGPSFPYDSVCAFLILCIRVASQDVRLYRLQLEEKALTWLIDTWRPTKAWDKLKMPSHTVQDILNLLTAIHGSGRHIDLLCEMLLPDCPIVAAINAEHSTAIIQDFILHARLPLFNTPSSISKGQSASESSAIMTIPTLSQDRDLTPPRARDERVSMFFLKNLDEFMQDLETQPNVERMRTALDLAMGALSFEAMLYINGTRMNRRTVQAACKVICGYLDVVRRPRWTWNERIFIIASLDPLLLAESRNGYRNPWESMLLPGKDTGIRQDVLRRMTTREGKVSQTSAKTRRAFQRALFQSADVSTRVACSLSGISLVLKYAHRSRMLFRTSWIPFERS